MTSHDAADQLAFFEAMTSGAIRAEAEVGHTDFHYSVAGHPIRLRIAGAGFAERLPTALGHLTSEPEDPPALTIRAWDDASTGTSLPRLLVRYLHFVEMHCFDYLGPRNEMVDFHGERLRAIMHLDPVIVSVFDPVRSEALYWTRDVGRIPVWDWGTPLRIILNEWAKTRELFLVHCGAVGTPDGGVIFAGKSGSGKSTSALACLGERGLRYAGDDYSLVSAAGRPYVHGLYSSAKLKGESDFQRFAHLVPLVSNRDQLDRQKALIFLNGAYRDRLISGFPLRAILVPQVSGELETTIEPASASAALKALAPSTMLQLPGDGKDVMRWLAGVVRKVPAFTLRSGTRMPGISAAVAALLDDLRSSE